MIGVGDEYLQNRTKPNPVNVATNTHPSKYQFGESFVRSIHNFRDRHIELTRFTRNLFTLCSWLYALSPNALPTCRDSRITICRAEVPPVSSSSISVL